MVTEHINQATIYILEHVKYYWHWRYVIIYNLHYITYIIFLCNLLVYSHVVYHWWYNTFMTNYELNSQLGDSHGYITRYIPRFSCCIEAKVVYSIILS